MTMMVLKAKHELPQVVADAVARSISTAVDKSGQCYCALSGGQSPQEMLKQLAQQNLPWEKVTFLMVDERYTDDQNNQNQTMLSQFIQLIPEPAPELVPLLQSPPLGTSIDATIDKANAAADTFPVELDLVILGMGMDGHTASIFPASQHYEKAMTTTARYLKVLPDEVPFPRISMSFHWLSQARNIFLYIPGRDKLECFNDLLDNPTSISPITSLSTLVDNLTVFSSED